MVLLSKVGCQQVSMLPVTDIVAISHNIFMPITALLPPKEKNPQQFLVQTVRRDPAPFNAQIPMPRALHPFFYDTYTMMHMIYSYES